MAQATGKGPTLALPFRLRILVETGHLVLLVATQVAAHAERGADIVFVAAPVIRCLLVIKAQRRKSGDRRPAKPCPAAGNPGKLTIEVDDAAGLLAAPAITAAGQINCVVRGIDWY